MGRDSGQVGPPRADWGVSGEGTNECFVVMRFQSEAIHNQYISTVRLVDLLYKCFVKFLGSNILLLNIRNM
jgi:hypothetical protein